MVEFNTVAKANVHCMIIVTFHIVNPENVIPLRPSSLDQQANHFSSHLSSKIYNHVLLICDIFLLCYVFFLSFLMKMFRL